MNARINGMQLGVSQKLICVCSMDAKKLIKIEVSVQDIWAHTRPLVQRSKKKYSRKKLKKGWIVE